MDRRTVGELARVLELGVPNAAERIEQHLRDETFREMYQEYEECTRCLRRWSESPEVHSARIQEYTDLIIDLQKEMLRYLLKHR